MSSLAHQQTAGDGIEARFFGLICHPTSSFIPD
jgi:hypothetical protein